MKHRRRQPAPGIFRLVLPLPFPGLDRVNAYLLAGEGSGTLIDCGIYDPQPERDHGWSELTDALVEAGSHPSEIDRLIVSHTHIDHYGMAGRLVHETGCELWMHQASLADLEVYRDPDPARSSLGEMLAAHGVDEAELGELEAFEDWRPFVSSVVEPTRPLRGGETFEAAGREWSVVYTPGHARSHICLFSPEDRILVSGDHLLGTITPHIDFRRGDTDPLGEFLSSLEEVAELTPELVLPGHGRPFADGADRARVVARHHERRLGAIVQVIRHEARTASEITDEIFGTTLLDFQRRLALGEALAHLAYLRRRGEIERFRDADGTLRYRKARRRESKVAGE